jgi:hypothetical protein
MKPRMWDLVLFVLASPILTVRALIRTMRRLRLLCRAVQLSMVCRTCGTEIPLIGSWRCRCGYTYQGHLLRFCPICRSFPRMVRCYHCRTTETIAM